MIFLTLFLAFCLTVSAQSPFKAQDLAPSGNYVPSYVLSDFNKLVLIAEKNAGKLHLFQGSMYLHSYPMTSGLNRGDKVVEGDKKTPLGIYILDKYLDSEILGKVYKDKSPVYGVGALTLNYPNPIDRRAHKTGSSIWIHGTSTPDRVKDLQSSQGCVVVHNETFEEILKLHQSEKLIMVIVDDLEWISKDVQQEYLKTFNGLRFRNQWFDLKTNKYLSPEFKL